MNLFQRAKGLLFKTVSAVAPTTQTAVLSRTDAATGVKKPVFARAQVQPETGLPSENFTGKPDRRVYGGPVTRPGFGYKPEVM